MNAQQAIHAINWVDYTHAYGSAEDVPAILDAILHGHSEDAWFDLWSYVHHQGSVYTATIPTIYVLRTWLGDNSVSEQHQIWDFLRGLVVDNFNLQPEQIKWYEKEELALVIQVRQAVLENFQQYLELAVSSDEVTRIGAYNLLGELPEGIDEILPFLQTAERSELASEGKNAALKAQGALLRQPLPEFTEARSKLLHHCLSIMAVDELPASWRSVAAQTCAVVDPEALPTNTPQIFFQELVADPEKHFDPAGDVNLFPLTYTFEKRIDLKQQWVIQLLQHPLPVIRDHAVFIVRELATENRSLRPWAVKILLQHLSSELEHDVLRKVAQTLGQMGQAGYAAVPALLGIANQVGHVAQLDAALALLQLRRPEGRAFIGRLLASQDIRQLSQTAQLLNELPDLAECGAGIVMAWDFVRSRMQEYEGDNSEESPLETGFAMTAIYNFERLAEHWASQIQDTTGPTLLTTFRQAAQERRETAFDRRAKAQNPPEIPEAELNGLVQRILQGDGRQNHALESVLPLIQPGSVQADLLAPFLRAAALNEQFGMTWERLHAAVALARLVGDHETFQQLWTVYSDWPYLYSEHGLNQLEAMQAENDILRPILTQMAYGERYTTGSFGPDTVDEDEKLQQRAQLWLERIGADTAED